MSFALTPIRKLVILSLVLHVISLFAVAFIVAFQLPLKSLIIIVLNGDIPFVLPNAISIARIAIIFIVHLVLTVAFCKVIKDDNAASSLKTVSILSSVFVIIIIPILSRILARIELLMLPRLGMEYFSSQNTLNFLMSYGLSIRAVALSILLIAASMAFYYCYLVIAGKDLQ